MTVSEYLRDWDQYKCKNVIKIFIISKPTLFISFILFKISISIKKINKSIYNNHNQLLKLLSGLITPIWGAADSILDEQWAAQSFIIYTHYSKDNILSVAKINNNTNLNI